MAGQVREPVFIESNRIAPYQGRGVEVSVVLDLMIHDIDLVHSFVRAPMVAVDANGGSVFSAELDVTNARIRFASGCVANLTGSRIGLKTERSLRIFQADAYFSADLHNRTLTRCVRKSDAPVRGPEDVMVERTSFDSVDPLLEQTRAFLESVAGGPAPVVSGRVALEALRTAAAIGEMVARSPGR
jgi:predicted dehydrogenase